MLQNYAVLASRAIRRDFLKPRIQENDFSAVDEEKDGSITVHNARFKTRIRASKQTHLEVYLKNGDVVDATIKGAIGRRSSARTDQRLKGDVARIRVIGCEELTNSERAQYHFLRSSLMEARHAPSFVTTIWFPGKAQGIERRDEGTHLLRDHGSQSDSILEKLNNSQRNIVGAMLSPAPQDSLVIVHGIVITFFNRWPAHTDANVTTQGLLERGKPPRLPERQRYGNPVDCRAG
jgi:regulator of nonsense transcripts 1